MPGNPSTPGKCLCDADVSVIDLEKIVKLPKNSFTSVKFSVQFLMHTGNPFEVRQRPSRRLVIRLGAPKLRARAGLPLLATRIAEDVATSAYYGLMVSEGFHRKEFMFYAPISLQPSRLTTISLQ